MRRESPKPPAAALTVGVVGYGLDRPLTGIGRYTMELLEGFARRAPEMRTILFAPFDTTGMKLPEQIEIHRLRSTRLLPAMLAFGPLQLALASRRRHLNVLFDPSGIGPYLLPRRIGGCARIVTIHDAVPFVYPDTQTRMTRFLFHRYLPRIVPRVDAVVTCSLASQTDLANYLQIPEGKIRVIPHGVSGRFAPASASDISRVLTRLKLPTNYILTVGSIEPRKNLVGLLRAYVGLREMCPDAPSLVIVGKRGWQESDVFRAIADHDLGDCVFLTGFVDDSDLPALYSGARCFVYPSLYEGFGLPPLEAMACGVPVITSSTSALPEVVGEAAKTLDPTNIDGIIEAMRVVLSQPETAAHMSESGLARSRLFSWDRSVSAHVDLFKSISEKELAHA